MALRLNEGVASGAEAINAARNGRRLLLCDTLADTIGIMLG